MIHVYCEIVYGRPLTKGVDTGPSCKELGFFENTIVSHLIYMCID